MTRAITLAGFAMIAGALLALQAYSLRTRHTLTFRELIGPVLRPLVGRLILMAAWLWLGWHIFVRVEL